eukprot:1160721-Pelagomonas_calceolata.AAC.1
MEPVVNDAHARGCRQKTYVRLLIQAIEILHFCEMVPRPSQARCLCIDACGINPQVADVSSTHPLRHNFLVGLRGLCVFAGIGGESEGMNKYVICDTSSWSVDLRLYAGIGGDSEGVLLEVGEPRMVSLPLSGGLSMGAPSIMVCHDGFFR